MPLRYDPFVDRLEPLRRLGQNVWVGYAFAIGSVALASAMRIGLGNLVGIAPFVTFYPAVFASALIGRARAGALAAVLSLVAAGLLFLPPDFSHRAGMPAGVALALFAAALALIVAVTGLLNEALGRLWQERSRLRLILESEPTGAIAVDETGTITLVNAAIEKQFGYARDEIIGQSIDLLLPADLRLAHAGQRRSFMLTPSVRKMGAARDLEGQRRDGVRFPVEIGLNPIEIEGRRGVLATVLDVSERKAAEARQLVLVQEIQHRARNLLALVQALSRRVYTPDRPLAEAHEKFVGVLQALSRSQDLLGGSDGPSLHAIAERELGSYHEQATIAGPHIMLSRNATQSFNLIIHELVTNAVKHGALSVPSGKVAVAWGQADGILSFKWTEAGGGRTPIATPRRGFGRMILQEMARELGEVSIDFSTGGLRYELRVPSNRALANRGLGFPSEHAP